MTVLIVDDDAINRKVLRAVLAAEGHAVVESEDGLTALQTLHHEKIDVVISDILSLILPQNRASRSKPTRYPGTNTPMRIAG